MEQIKEIFTLSYRYKEEGEIKSYYWLWFPCEISGRLVSDNKVCDFVINAGTTAKWHAADENIYWGAPKKNVIPCLFYPIQVEATHFISH